MNHHAICYLSTLQAEREIGHFFVGAEPDVHIYQHDELGINEARELARRSTLLPLVAPTQVFVVKCQTLTHEAQNALLKLLEEPPQRTQFYLVLPKRGLLLPTLQSRLHFIDDRLTSLRPAYDPSLFTDFQHASYAQRMEHIALWAKQKDTVTMENILEGIEQFALKTKHATLLKEVGLVRDHFSRKGASKKMLLESLALSLPLGA